MFFPRCDVCVHVYSGGKSGCTIQIESVVSSIALPCVYACVCVHVYIDNASRPRPLLSVTVNLTLHEALYIASVHTSH